MKQYTLLNHAKMNTKVVNRLVMDMICPNTKPGLTISIWQLYQGLSSNSDGIYFPDTHTITIYLPEKKVYPIKAAGCFPYKPCIIETPYLFLVRTLSHELRHAWQETNNERNPNLTSIFGKPQGVDSWGLYLEGYRYCELDAENYSINIFNKYKQKQKGGLLNEKVR